MSGPERGGCFQGGQSYHPLGNCIPYPLDEGGADLRVPAVSLLGSDSLLGIGQFLASQARRLPFA
eukprot:1759418-Rhodomonas_salina.2